MESLRTDDNPLPRVELSDAEWKTRLTPEQYRVLRHEGTEMCFTGDLLQEKRAGKYHCAGCHLSLFVAEKKFESGTGWPSFFDPADPSHIETRTDWKLAVPRTEVRCARCGGHLGHVFEDGPPPTGLRYCLNSAALVFVAS